MDKKKTMIIILQIPAKSSSAVYFAVTAIDVTTPLNTDVVVEVVSGTSGHAARHTYTSVVRPRYILPSRVKVHLSAGSSL